MQCEKKKTDYIKKTERQLIPNLKCISATRYVLDIRKHRFPHSLDVIRVESSQLLSRASIIYQPTEVIFNCLINVISISTVSRRFAEEIPLTNDSISDGTGDTFIDASDEIKQYVPNLTAAN